MCAAPSSELDRVQLRHAASTTKELLRAMSLRRHPGLRIAIVRHSHFGEGLCMGFLVSILVPLFLSLLECTTLTKS